MKLHYINTEHTPNNEAQQDRHTADQLLKEGRDAEARPIYLRLWENGVQRAALSLGRIEERKGLNDLKNLSEAENWYRRAQEKMNDNAAKFSVARIILLRHQLDESSRSDERINAAIKLLEDLSEKEIPQAAVYLGLIFFAGNVTSINKERAEQLFRIGEKYEFLAALSMLMRISFHRKKYITVIRYALKIIRVFISLIGKPSDPRFLGVKKL